MGEGVAAKAATGEVVATGVFWNTVELPCLLPPIPLPGEKNKLNISPPLAFLLADKEDDDEEEEEEEEEALALALALALAV